MYAQKFACEQPVGNGEGYSDNFVRNLGGENI